MSVYVDPIFHQLGPRGQTDWCHMVADTEGELHEMADRIGLRREWYHRHHYNLTPESRTLAISLGAVEATTRECARKRREHERPRVEQSG